MVDGALAATAELENLIPCHSCSLISLMSLFSVRVDKDSHCQRNTVFICLSKANQVELESQQNSQKSTCRAWSNSVITSFILPYQVKLCNGFPRTNADMVAQSDSKKRLEKDRKGGIS